MEKSWGPNYLRLGLGLSTDFRGDAFFNLLASYRQTWLNRLGGEWRSDLQVGRTSRVATEFYQPVEPGQTFFVAPSASLGEAQGSAHLPDQPQRIASVRHRAKGASPSEAGAQFTRYGELRLGLERAERAPLPRHRAALRCRGDRRSQLRSRAVTLRGLGPTSSTVSSFPGSGLRGFLHSR